MCKQCDWETTISKCEDMLEDDEYEFAYDIISGINDWVIDNEHCTQTQKLAVRRIYNAKRC